MKKNFDELLELLKKNLTWRNFGIVTLVILVGFFLQPVIGYFYTNSTVSTTILDAENGKVVRQAKTSGTTPSIQIIGTNVVANVAISYGGNATAGGLAHNPSGLYDSLTNYPISRGKIQQKPIDKSPGVTYPAYRYINTGDRSFDLESGEIAIFEKDQKGKIADIKPADLEVKVSEYLGTVIKNPKTNTVHVTLTWDK